MVIATLELLAILLIANAQLALLPTLRLQLAVHALSLTPTVSHAPQLAVSRALMATSPMRGHVVHVLQTVCLALHWPHVMRVLLDTS